MKLGRLLVKAAAAATVVAGFFAMSAWADFTEQWTYEYAPKEGYETLIKESPDTGIYVTTISGVTPKSGKNFLYSRYPAIESQYGLSGGSMIAKSEPMKLENGKTYRVSYWYNAANNADGMNLVYIADSIDRNTLVSDVKNFDYKETIIPNDGVWKYRDFTFTYDEAKSKSPSMYFNMQYTSWSGGSSTYYIDDCRVVAVDDPTETNLLQNGDFEKASQQSAWGAFSTTGVMSLDKIKVENGGLVGDKQLHISYPAEYRQKDTVGIYSNPIKLEKGKKYILSLNEKVDGELGVFYAKFANANDIYSTVQVCGDWEYGVCSIPSKKVKNEYGFDFINAEFTANDNYDSVRLVFYLPRAAYGNLSEENAAYIYENKWYMDSVRLCEEGSEVNLIEDGSFENNPGNERWNYEYINASEACKMEIGKFDIKADGENSIKVTYPENGSGTLRLWSEPIEGLEDGASYILTFYSSIDVDKNADGLIRGILNENDAVGYNKDGLLGRALSRWFWQDISKTECENGMYRYQWTFTYNKVGVENPRVLFEFRKPFAGADGGYCTDAYFDGISLLKDGTTKNLLKDGDFEGGRLSIGTPEISGENVSAGYVFKKGKTTISAEVSNTTDKSANVAIIAAYYLNNKLIGISEKDYVIGADNEQKVSVDIDINDISAIGTSEIRCFVWDGIDTMKPLAAGKKFIVSADE